MTYKSKSEITWVLLKIVGVYIISTPTITDQLIGFDCNAVVIGVDTQLKKSIFHQS